MGQVYLYIKEYMWSWLTRKLLNITWALALWSLWAWALATQVESAWALANVLSTWVSFGALWTLASGTVDIARRWINKVLGWWKKIATE